MRLFWLLPAVLLAAACAPRIEVAPPKEPITINLNVKIEHEIRVSSGEGPRRAIQRTSQAFSEGFTR